MRYTGADVAGTDNTFSRSDCVIWTELSDFGCNAKIAKVVLSLYN